MDGRRGQVTPPGLDAEGSDAERERQAADAGRRTEALAAARGRVTMWSFVGVGIVFGLAVLAFATGDTWWRIAATFLCIAASIGSSLAYRAATGDAPPALWNGPSTLWAIPLLIEVLAAVLLVRPAVEATDSSAPAWILAALVAASSALYGVLSGRAISRRRVASS